MNTYIGIDIGTSSVKLLLLQSDGKILAQNTQAYPVYYPHSGWSEQNPEDWYEATVTGIKELMRDQDASKVKGLSFGGQMHGLVVLDKDDNVIRPAILWNDGRTEKQTLYLNNVVGKEKLSLYTANIAFAGFTAPKILWMKENEPDNFEKITKIMLPKDYLCYRFTGHHVTDFSDASGMLILDVKNRCWSKKMCKICHIKSEWLPELKESFEVAGLLKDDVADICGLPENVKVCTGAGDNAAAAVGTGAVYDGSCNISLGTSGTVFISSDKFTVDKFNALHSFCHSNGKYHQMGCILSAASCNSWWSDNILSTKDYENEQRGLEKYLGENQVFFLPYLMGERSPHNDVNARGAFIGMRSDTTRKQMTLAVLEGVAFALRDCVEIAKNNGINIKSSTICGGGAKSKLWQKIIANVLGMPIKKPVIEEGPSYGGAILAMVGCGEYNSVEDAVSVLLKIKNTVYPDDKIVKKYNKKYDIFKKLYPSLKECFNEIKD